MICPLDTIPDTAQLQNNRLFVGIPAELISDFGCDMTMLHYDRGDLIFSEGEPGDCLYLVIEGSIRISKAGRGGQQETLGFIAPGNFFGEMALIDGQPRSAQAAAAEPAVLGKLDAESFDRILENAPRDLYMNFVRLVVERLRGVNSHFITELMRTERLSLLGTMANSIIHDLNNPIQALQSCSELIDERCADPSVKTFTRIMRKSVENMTDMVQELLDFARGQSSLAIQRQPVLAVLEEFDSQLVRLIPEKVHLVREVSCCADVRVDAGRFVRVLLNLVKNSVEAMPKGGVLRLEIFQLEDCVIFRVADTGAGIPEELLPKIFEPFVTYGKSKGTGLGMAIVRSVVEAHHGAIEIRSKVGVGTTVEIVLPTFDALSG